MRAVNGLKIENMSAEKKQNYRKAKNLAQLSPQELVQHLKYELATRELSIRSMCLETGLNYTYVIAILNQNRPTKAVNFDTLATIASYLGYHLSFAMIATE